MNDERKPGDEWHPEDPTEIDPGLIQLYGFTRCRDCKAQRQIAVTVEISKVQRNELQQATVLEAKDVLLPDGWTVVDGKVVCIEHNPNRKKEG